MAQPSAIAPAIPSARRRTATAPTWTTWKRTRNGKCCRATCFSVEPGIYLPEFGVRSEVNVFVDGQRQVHVTGGAPQTPALCRFCRYMVVSRERERSFDAVAEVSESSS